MMKRRAFLATVGIGGTALLSGCSQIESITGGNNEDVETAVTLYETAYSNFRDAKDEQREGERDYYDRNWEDAVQHYRTANISLDKAKSEFTGVRELIASMDRDEALTIVDDALEHTNDRLDEVEEMRSKAESNANASDDAIIYIPDPEYVADSATNDMPTPNEFESAL